jgi:hypothetical protein
VLKLDALLESRTLVTIMSEVMPHSPEYLAESAASTIRGTVWTATSVALLTVILRCYTRLWLRKVIGTDDVLIVLSVVTTLKPHNQLALTIHRSSSLPTQS